MEINLTKRPFTKLLGAFFSLAGLYHFVNPNFYYGLIPDYLPYPMLINYGVGLVEMVLGFLVLIPKYRKIGGYGILILLLLLIPSHIFFIQTGSCVPNGYLGVGCLSFIPYSSIGLMPCQKIKRQ